MAIPTSIPFLEAAYRQRPQQPDTGGMSFMRAFERAQERKIDEPQRLVQQQMAQLQLQKAQIDLASTVRTQQDRIAAEGALTVFGDRIRRAQMLGPSEPAAQRSVLEWVERNRGLLTLPAGEALWKDYLSSVELDRKNKFELEKLQAQEERSLATQAAMGERQMELEKLRQTGRMTLEQARADLRRELQVGRANVTREGWIQRMANNFVGRALPGETLEERDLKYRGAVESLGRMFDDVVSEFAAPGAPAAAPAALTREAPARPTTQAEFDALPAGSWFINPADKRLLQKR